jgi:preprotein translocase SecE subunit
VARDRKRAKQRQQRRGTTRPVGEGGRGADQRGSQLTRADLPGALEHVGDVDEFDAALVRGGAPRPQDVVGMPVEADEVLPEAPEAEDGAAAGGNGSRGGSVALPGARAVPARQPLPTRAMGFLRSSWAELQRVQWPDRRQVTQATAVVLGFVAVAGVYFGVADYVAKEIVEAIL